MLITSSKDKTLKFWRFKQLRPQEVAPNQPVINNRGNEGFGNGLIEPRPRPPRNRGGYDRNDPLMGGDEDDYHQPGGHVEQQEEVRPVPQTKTPKPDFTKKKDEDSDEDLTGWDT